MPRKVRPTIEDFDAVAAARAELALDVARTGRAPNGEIVDPDRYVAFRRAWRNAEAARARAESDAKSVRWELRMTGKTWIGPHAKDFFWTADAYEKMKVNEAISAGGASAPDAHIDIRRNEAKARAVLEVFDSLGTQDVPRKYGSREYLRKLVNAYESAMPVKLDLSKEEWQGGHTEGSKRLRAALAEIREELGLDLPPLAAPRR
jgi:hypothetical protein